MAIPTPTTPAPERKEYQILIDKFMELDQECEQLIDKLKTGKILIECLPPEGAPSLGVLMDKLTLNFRNFQEYLKNKIEERNAILQQAASAMRGEVMAGENIVRGPDGKATTLEYGPFEVSSKTSRSFNYDRLREVLEQRGLLQRFHDLQTTDKKTGEPLQVVRTETTVMYEPAKNFLRELNMEDVINYAYEEEESTPAVTGPKPIAFVGDTEKKKK